MARLSGKTGEVTQAGGTIAGIKSWTLDQEVEALEGTGFDSSGLKGYSPGLSGWKGSFEGYKDGAPLTIGTEVALVLKESQTATQKFTGQAIITKLGVKTDIAGLVAYSYEFQGTGALTIATA
ncbi:MAG: hypothetical protein WC683_13610 [bacterium]